MKKSSCCIAIYPDHAQAALAMAELKSIKIDSDFVSLVARDVQQGQVGTAGLSSLHDELLSLGVQESNIYCYLCLIHGGSALLIVSGNHQQVEYACNYLEKRSSADTALHLNSP